MADLRLDVLPYLGAILDDVLADAGIAVEDAASNLKEPLDAAEAGMAFTDLDLTDDAGREAAFFALAEYQTLLRVKRKIAMRFDIGTGGDSYALSQPLKQIDSLIATAKERAIALAGLAAVNGAPDPNAANETGVGAGIDLDWSVSSWAPTDEYGREWRW